MQQQQGECRFKQNFTKRVAEKTIGRVCESYSLTVSESFARAEDEGVTQLTQTIVAQRHIRKANTSAN